MLEREMTLAISRFYVAQFDFTVVGVTAGYWLVEDEAHIL